MAEKFSLHNLLYLGVKKGRIKMLDYYQYYRTRHDQ